MRKLSNILVLSMLLVAISGCKTLFDKKITSKDINNTREAAQIEERASAIRESAFNIRMEAGQGAEALRQDIEGGLFSEKDATPRVERWGRIDAEGKLIEELSTLNQKSGSKIVKISVGTWHTTIWFRAVIAFIILALITIAGLVVTYLAKQWGFIGYVRRANEAIQDSIAMSIDHNPNIDNYHVDEDTHRRIIRQRKERNRSI